MAAGLQGSPIQIPITILILPHPTTAGPTTRIIARWELPNGAGLPTLTSPKQLGGRCRMWGVYLLTNS